VATGELVRQTAASSTLLPLAKLIVEARYSKHYKITAEELAWLAGCMEQLVGVVDAVCADGTEESE